MGCGAEPQMGGADVGRPGGQLPRRHGHLHMAQQRLTLGGLAGEADAEQLTHGAAAAVATDEVARAQLRAVGQLGGHPVFVLAQPDQFNAAPDLGAFLIDRTGSNVAPSFYLVAAAAGAVLTLFLARTNETGHRDSLRQT